MQTLDAILEDHPYPEFRELAAVWRRHGGGDTLPRRRSIDLMDTYRIAANLVVLDLEGDFDGVCRFRWRYAGSALRTLAGMEITGRYDADVFHPEHLDRLRTVYADILRTGQPHAWRHHVISPDQSRDFLYYHRLMLPLADDAGEPRHLIGVYRMKG